MTRTKERVAFITIALFIVALVLAGFVHWSIQQAECEKRGGAYVRGLFNMKCVQEVR